MLKERCSLQTFPGGIDSQVPEGSGRKKERPMMLATLMLGQTTSLKESFPWNRSQVLIFCSWAKARAFTSEQALPNMPGRPGMGGLVHEVTPDISVSCPQKHYSLGREI